MPAKYVRPYSKGQKNDFRDAEAIAEAVQRPTMKFVATKTAEQLDLQALHRVRERLVSQRTGIINQIRAFLLEQRDLPYGRVYGSCALSCHAFSPVPPDVLSPRMVCVIEGLAEDWRRLEEHIGYLSDEIAALAQRSDSFCTTFRRTSGRGTNKGSDLERRLDDVERRSSLEERFRELEIQLAARQQARGMRPSAVRLERPGLMASGDHPASKARKASLVSRARKGKEPRGLPSGRLIHNRL